MPKRSSRKMDDDLRAEYDFSALQVVARGPGRKTVHDINVRLAPDVAETFPDSDSVNDALRLLIRIAKGHMNARGESTQASGQLPSEALHGTRQKRRAGERQTGMRSRRLSA